MTNGITISGNGFIKLRALLHDYQNRMRQSATLDVGWDERTEYPDGTPVGKVARVQEYGAVIDHPGGTKYINDAVVGKRGSQRIATRFVSNSFRGKTETTQAHQIVIPPRPFIRPAIHQNRAEWMRQIDHDLKETNLPLDVILERVGIVIVGDIQLAIKNVQSPALAKSTVQKRLSKGFSDQTTATKPLIDTGVMLRTCRAQVTMGSVSAVGGFAPSAPPSPPAPVAPDVVAPPTTPAAPAAPKQSLWRRAVNFVKGVFGR